MAASLVHGCWISLPWRWLRTRHSRTTPDSCLIVARVVGQLRRPSRKPCRQRCSRSRFLPASAHVNLTPLRKKCSRRCARNLAATSKHLRWLERKNEENQRGRRQLNDLFTGQLLTPSLSPLFRFKLRRTDKPPA